MKKTILFIALIFSVMLSAQDSLKVELDVVEKGYYEVYMDNVKISQHSKPLKAMAKLLELSLKYPKVSIFMTQPNVEAVTLLELPKIDTEEPPEEPDPKDYDSLPPIDIPEGKLPAFPGAEGYGKYAVGGRGGKVYYVTNLNDSGEGSLRAFAQDSSGPRNILFKVGGRINLKSTINITNPYLTISGHSAPGDGIAISAEGTPNIPLVYLRTNDIIIRYIRFRRSTEQVSTTNSDCLAIREGSNNIIIDHISTSGGSDEVLSIFDYNSDEILGVRNITIQNSIIGRGFKGSSKGNLTSGAVGQVSYYKNLFASNFQRNPLIKVDVGDGVNEDTYFEIINNVIYDAKFKTSFSDNDTTTIGVRKLNYINNHYFENGSDRRRMLQSDSKDPVAIYARGNIAPTRKTISSPVNWTEEWNITQGTDAYFDWDNDGENEMPCTELGQPCSYPFIDLSYQRKVPFNTPIVVDEVPLLDALDVFENIKSTVGASLPKRDAYDAARISDAINLKRTVSGSFQPFNTYNSGKPYVDTDNDGMADDWELRQFGSLDRDGTGNTNGYTDLELYLYYLINKSKN